MQVGFFSILHALIPSYTFIVFRKNFQPTRLFHPARLFGRSEYFKSTYEHILIQIFLGSTKRKSGLKSKLKKAAVVGVGVYGAYKVNKLKKKFGKKRRKSYEFDDWNDWREADGFLCRNDNDCQWIDERLSCEDYELEFTPVVSFLDNYL